MTNKIKRIRSGGQTGVDRAALDVARKYHRARSRQLTTRVNRNTGGSIIMKISFYQARMENQ